MSPRWKRIALVLPLAIVSVGGGRTIYPSLSQDITLRPLALDPKHSGSRRVGELIFLNAWELRSDNENFGGISALAGLSDGRFVGVGDAGTVIGFGLTTNDKTDRPFIAPLPDSQGQNVTYKDRDSEGIARDPDSGQFWISYEANHAIRRFSPSLARRTGLIRMSGRYHWPKNKGIEAIIRLSDGRFVAIGENLEKGLHEGFLFSGDPVEPGSARTSFDYQPPPGYRVTDGAQLPNGNLLILNRRISLPTGFSAKIAIVETEAITTGARIQGRTIASIGSPLLIDNMEGVAITTESGDIIIWLISDNNFSIFQRTLLMKFRLAERHVKKKPEAVAAPGFNSL